MNAEKVLADGEGVTLGRMARFHGQHILSPRHGVAIHINAFNFPAWGMAEKAATALLAGMPVLTKPATSSAMVSHRIMEILVEKAVLPEGDTPHHGKLMDLLMLTVTGGMERTEAQFAKLLLASGFRLVRVCPTATHQSIVEAVLA